jgi:hypothetical protein
MGNRIAKHVYDELGVLQHSTFYVRDAQGNVMAVYEQEVTVPEGEGPPATPSITYHLTERHIYGSARLGMDRTVVEMAPTTIQAYPLEPTIPATEESERYLGRKYYELTNHLGNVLTVITDEKRMVLNGSNYSHYESVVVSVTDYSPFGVSLTGRTFTTTEGYRYSYQAQEHDDEMKGKFNSFNFSFRMHDSRLGKFLSLDPLLKTYPWNSPYAFSLNRVIDAIELEGLELMDADDARLSVVNGLILLKVENFSESWQDRFKSQVSGQDHLGNPTIGAARDIGVFGIGNRSTGEFQHPDYNSQVIRAIYEAHKEKLPLSGEMQGTPNYNEWFSLRASPAVINPTNNSRAKGGPDVVMSGPSNGKAFARGWLAVNAIVFVRDQMAAYSRWDDVVDLKTSQKALNTISLVIGDAMKTNFIPKEHQNLHDISIIMNLILDGTGNEPLINIGSDGQPSGVNTRSLKLQEIANDTMKKYSFIFKTGGFNPDKKEK